MEKIIIEENLNIIISEYNNNILLKEFIKKHYIDLINNLNNEITNIEITATEILINDIQKYNKYNKYNDLNQFIRNIIKYSYTEKNTLLIALIYLNKIKKSTKLGCVKQMFIISLIIAGKYHKDNNHSLIAWSKLCNLPKKKLLEYERTFLKILNYELYINENDFYYFYCKIQLYYYINIK